MLQSTRYENEPDYKKIPPLPLHEFRGVSATSPMQIPEIAKNRKCTNIFCLIPVIIIVLLWIIVSIIVLSGVEMEFIMNGGDECGNICGVNNVKLRVPGVEEGGCEPKDYTDYPINLISDGFECIENCEHKMIFNRCFEDEKTVDKYLLIAIKFLEAYYDIWKMSLAVIIIAIVISFLVFFAYRLRTAVTYWFFQILIVALVAAYSGLFWYLTVSTDLVFIVPAIAFTIIVFVIIGFLVYTVLSGRYKMIVAIIAEASVAVFKIPVLLLFPIMSLFIVFAMHLFLYFMFIPVVVATITAMHGTNESDFGLVTVSTGVLIWYYFSELAAFFVVNAFMNGFQCMVVAGSVAAYYFTNDKFTVGNMAFVNSLYVTTRYHLGTVAEGSLVITAVSITRTLTEVARYQIDNGNGCLVCCYYCFLCCICLLEEIAEYLAKRAYIMTAMHGKGLLDSGKRAARLIWLFLLDTVMVDVMAANAMNGAGMFIFLATMGFSFLLLTGEWYYNIFPAFLLMVYVGTTLFFYISMMNVAITATYLCFCEDKLMNDGSSSHPYFMTKRLMNVMQNADEKAKEKHTKRRVRFSTNR